MNLHGIDFIRVPFDIARSMLAIMLCIVACGLVALGAAALYAAKIIDDSKVSEADF